MTACAPLAFTAVPAYAQDADREEARAPQGVYEGDIIVTARRRDETAQDTPVAMTVLSDELLDRYNVTGVDSIAQFTPGLLTGESSGSMGGSISLRGIGSGESMAFVDQAVSVNVDGVPISSAQILRAAQMDLRQIEVLRGPQALFFGKNSPGGIISITTEDPGPTLELLGRVGYEFKADEFYVDSVISGPLGDDAGVRLATHYSTQKGYIKVVTPNAPGTNAPPPGVIPSDLGRFPDKEEIFIRASAKFTPTDRLTIRLKETYTDTDIVGGPSFYSDITACPYGVGQGRFEDASNCQNDGVIFTSQLDPSFLALSKYLEGPYGGRNNTQLLTSGQVDWEMTDHLKLSSVTGYYFVNERITSNGGYGPTSSNAFAVRFKNKQFSQELRLASDFGGQFDFLVGGFYENRDLFTLTFIGVPGINFPLPLESTNQNQKSYSGFGQVIFRPTESLELTAGGRYTHETKDLLDFTVTPTGGVPTDVTEDPRYPDTRLSFNNFSPEVTVKYEASPDFMVFASFKKGFKSGGFDAGFTNGAILANPARGQTFDPEKVTGGEVGLKSRLLDRQLTFNVTGYWYDYDGLQVSVFDTNSRAFRLQNAAKARIRGVELESSFSPNGLPGFNVHGALSINDSEFRDYLADCYAGQTVALGCDRQFDPVLDRYTAQDLSGRRLRKAPVVTGNFGTYYETPVTGSTWASLSADVSYSGKYNAGTQLQPLAEQSAYAKLDASLRIFAEDKSWELALIGRNLTNKRNLINGIDRTGTGGAKGVDQPSCTAAGQTGCVALADIIGTPATPRSVSVQATLRY
ncbi:hypothetical protein B2G71_02790 [Novosphingobium sp. PC22D]|nr:hypothetical protein B2G71_02790 [Novosphingobium sp. PC22D]